MLNFCVFTFIAYAVTAIVRMLFYNNGNGARSFAQPVHNQPPRRKKELVENRLRTASKPEPSKPNGKIYELPRRRYRDCA